VLVDERSSGTGVSKPGHQLFETRASGSGEGSARMPEIVKMEVRLTRVLARLDPYAVEVGSPEPCPLRADEDKTTLPRLGEPLQMPPNLGYEVGVKSDAPTTRLRLWCLRLQHARIKAAPAAPLARRQRRALALARPRPAHAGPHPHGPLAASRGQAHRGLVHSQLPRVRLSQSRPPPQWRPCRAVACDRLRRPLTRRPLTRGRQP
jgi:hypothetical protein